MAPELRKKKSAATVATKSSLSKIKSPATKRKAAEDASPVAVKKAKSTKPSSKSKKAAKAAKPVEPDSESEPDAEPEPNVQNALVSTNEPACSGEEEEDEATTALAKIVDSDDDEGDEDEAEQEDSTTVFQPGQDVGKAPVPTLSTSSLTKSLQQHSREETGVVYIGRIPHGFYEHEMRSYFSQFGDIVNLRMSRNKRTGRSKHYAFIEFAELSTAEIVAKTMQNYLMFGHLLKCVLVPKAQCHVNLFKGANRRFKAVPMNKIAGGKLKRARSESQWAKRVENERERRSAKADKLKELGYEFEAPELKVALAKEEVKAIVGTDDEVDADVGTNTIEAPPAETEGKKADEKDVEESVDNAGDDGEKATEALDEELAVKPTKKGKQNPVTVAKKTKKAKTKKVKA